MSEVIKYATNIGWVVMGLFLFFLLDIGNYGYIGGYLLFVIIYAKKEFILGNLDIDFLLIVIFSVIYSLFSILSPPFYIQNVLFFGLFPPLFYLLGKYFVQKTPSLKLLYQALLLVGFLYSFSALVSVLLNLLQGGFIQFDRSIAMFWGGNTRTATLMAAYLTFNMCIPAIVLTSKDRLTQVQKIVCLVIFVLSLLCVFRLGSRTQLVIFLITLLTSILFVVPKQSIGQNVRLAVTLMLTVGLIYLYVPLDLDSEYLSVLGDRLQGNYAGSIDSAGGRTEKWAKSLNNLFNKPLGWDVEEFGHSHNLWLDVARINGLLPLLFLLIFTFRTWANTKKAIDLNKGEISFNTLILSFTLAANLLFFVEPVTEGLFSIFLIYCFFQGAIKKYLLVLKENRAH